MKSQLKSPFLLVALMAPFALGIMGCGSSAEIQDVAKSRAASGDRPSGLTPVVDAPTPLVRLEEAGRTAVPGDGLEVARVDTQVKPAAHGEVVRPKFDPIAENGKYFEGWKTPALALVISGRQDGYLEPCGCAGLDRQIGGLSRRHALVRQLTEQGWPVAAVDVGGLVRRFGKQAEIQFAIAADALKQIGYGAVGFGPSDLRLSAGEIVAAVAGADPKDSIFVSANVDLFGLTPKVRIVEIGGLKLGITAVLGKEYQEQIHNDEVTIRPAADALREVVPELKDCDICVLLAHATADESKALARQFPSFDLVVTSDGAPVPPQQPATVEGTRTRLIEATPKGGYATVVGFYTTPKPSMRFQRVALDSRFADTPEMKQVMANYQQQLEQLGWEGLHLRSVPHPRASAGDKLSGKFASADSCKECHPTAYGVWSKTKHAHATETLARLDPPRLYDPECISCHSTGWNPSEFVPFVGGFDSLNATPQLTGNSCENCHGPGAAHVAAEKGRNSAKRAAEREAMKLSVAFARDNVCMKCHDHDNSPAFTEKDKATGKDNFDVKYWPAVEHRGKR